MATIKSFEDLEIGQLARVLCDKVNTIIISSPLKNDYKQKEQINGSLGVSYG